MNIKNQKYLAILFCLITILFFIIFKIAKYNLSYYYGDLFGCLQTIRSWTWDFSCSWTDKFRNFTTMHITYISIFFIPFTFLFGTKGIFIAHGLLIFTGIGAFILIKDKFIETNFWLCFIIIALLGLGPYSFWLFDNPPLGWFFDLLFLPLSLFFALALKSKKTVLVFISGLLLVITKEDGPVIACCISIYYMLLHYSPEMPVKFFIRKLMVNIGFWMLIFTVSMLIIYASNNFGAAKLNTTLDFFSKSDNHIKTKYFSDVFSGFSIMMIPVCLLLLFSFKTRYFLFSLLALIPVIIIGLISGFAYLPNNSFSLTWTARFSEILGVLLATSVITMQAGFMRSHVLKFFTNKFLLFAFAAIILLAQTMALGYVRSYNPADEILAVNHADLPAGITNKRLSYMTCIAEKVPDSVVVLVPENYENLFENHQYAWIQNLESAPKQPGLIILDDTLQFKTIKIDYSSYSVTHYDKFFLLLSKEIHVNLSPCETDVSQLEISSTKLY